MTQPAAPPVRTGDVWGIVALVLAGPFLLGALAVFLVGLIPSMNAIWWLALLLIPVLALVGVVVVVLAVVGVVLGIRRRRRFIASAIALALGLVMIVPAAMLVLTSV